jgi:hypothetical protein
VNLAIPQDCPTFKKHSLSWTLSIGGVTDSRIRRENAPVRNRDYDFGASQEGRDIAKMILAVNNTAKTGIPADRQWTIEWTKSRLGEALRNRLRGRRAENLDNALAAWAASSTVAQAAKL